MKKFIKNFWIDQVQIKSAIMILIAVGLIILINLLVFQTSCTYPYTPKWLCWTGKPNFIQWWWVLPFSLGAFAALILLIVKKFR